ncbi:MAG: electron transfer flavoprotein subunit alpha/FixB family protein [Pyrodictiaceae archaeon]
MSTPAAKRKEKKVDCEKLCPEWGCRQPYEYEGVWVVGELEDGNISEPSLQMLTPARRVADKLETFVEGVLLGYDKEALERAAREMIYHGADRVRVLVDPERLKPYIAEVYARTIAFMADKYKPEIIFFPATMRGRELAPYVANTLRAGITADCTQFDVDQDGDLLMIRPPFAAILLAYIKTPTRRPQISTARPNIFPTPERDETRKGEIIWEDPSTIPIPRPRTRLLKVEILKREELPIEKAEYIVAGGRGVGTPEGFKMLEELARLLGGVVAGSRKAVDLGLIPHEKQVGQTGKSVRAKLYIAVGISGAAQHTVGIRECNLVVAINKDPDAPIFKAADYGIVADWREVVPILIEELRKLKETAR